MNQKSGLGLSPTSYVEVYDEPDHLSCCVNEYIYAYRVQLAPGRQTLWHRHCKDTVYLSLGAAKAGEELVTGAQVATDIPCGVAVSREHFEEPLIHKVTNKGLDPFFLVGIEAHAVVGRLADEKALSESHELLVETKRFKVFSIVVENSTKIRFPESSLLVSNTESAFDQNGKRITLQRGDVYWFEEALIVSLRGRHRFFLVVLL